MTVWRPSTRSAAATNGVSFLWKPVRFESCTPGLASTRLACQRLRRPPLALRSFGCPVWPTTAQRLVTVSVSPDRAVATAPRGIAARRSMALVRRVIASRNPSSTHSRYAMAVAEFTKLGAQRFNFPIQPRHVPAAPHEPRRGSRPRARHPQAQSQSFHRSGFLHISRQNFLLASHSPVVRHRTFRQRTCLAIFAAPRSRSRA